MQSLRSPAEPRLWLLRIDSSQFPQIAAREHELPKSFRDRISRFKRIEDIARSVAGVLLARRALAATLEISANALPPLIYDARGRPHLPAAMNWPGDFNLSHAGEFVACIIHPHGRAGVDLEEISTITSGMEFMCLAPYEFSEIVSKYGADRSIFFYRRWSLKEAYLKALGTGFTREPNSFGFMFPYDGSERPILIDTQPPGQSKWIFKTIPLPGYSFAVCTEALPIAEDIYLLSHIEQTCPSRFPPLACPDSPRH